MINCLLNIKKHREQEKGVIALLTLGFFVAAGMAIIVLLWSIGVITGAFNALYAANQAAAYAAASSTHPFNEESDEDFATQLGINCQTPDDQTLCVGGDAYRAANTVMLAALGPDSQGANFNLTYTGDNSGNVFLTDQSYNRRNAFRVYEIERPPGEAEYYAEQNGCPIPPGKDYGETSDIPGSPNTSINCWRLTEFGVNFPRQYQSAVIMRSRADLTVIPGCTLDICQITLKVVAAASEDQPRPYDDYDDYYVPLPAESNP